MKKKSLCFLIFFIAVIMIATTFGWKKKNDKPYFLSVVAIMKNEKPYLKEWLEYHMLQGVEHFYLCDNDSTDGTEEYLQPYITQNIITYVKMHGFHQQRACYQKIVETYKDDTTWLAIIDLDEFLVPLQKSDMRKFLKEFDDVDEVSLQWMVYGDNDAISRPEGLVTEFFTSHSRKLNHTVKSIVRPEAVKSFSPVTSNHYVPVKGKSVNEYHKPVDYMLSFHISADKARINHYILKSYEEFLYKKKRGHQEGVPIDYGYYIFHNENESKNDTSMLRFLPQLKKRMKKSPLKDIPIPRVADIPSSYEDIKFSEQAVYEMTGRKVGTPQTLPELMEIFKNSHHPDYRRN